MIEASPHDVSQFNQKIYGVYVSKRGGLEYYYLGDLREFPYLEVTTS